LYWGDFFFLSVLLNYFFLCLSTFAISEKNNKKGRKGFREREREREIETSKLKVTITNGKSNRKERKYEKNVKSSVCVGKKGFQFVVVCRS